MGCVWEIPWPKRYNHVSGSRLSPRSKNPKISGILKFGYIFQFFRTELTSKNPKTLPIEFLVKQDRKIQKCQKFCNSDIFFIFFVQNWLPRTQRPFPLNSWWKNGPFWCKNHCSSSKTVDFSIFSGGARKKVGPLGGPLSDMTPNTLVYHFSYIFRKSQWVWGVLAPK